MRNLRLIARLDIKGPNLIKGVRLEGLRVIGDPSEYAKRYYEEGVDEILYVDIVASLYERDSLRDIIQRTAKNVFVPITVAGGVRSVEDASLLLRAGADKIAVNTAAVKNPSLITEIAKNFGSSCMVISIEAKRRKDGGWEVYTDNGREHTGLDVVEWAIQAEKLGAGEILLTSVDQEGTQKGFDVELLKAVCSRVSIPVIASGGMGSMEHLSELVKQAEPDAVAFAHVLHYKKMQLAEIRRGAREEGFPVRSVEAAEVLKA